jgi:hypothetical protein
LSSSAREFKGETAGTVQRCSNLPETASDLGWLVSAAPHRCGFLANAAAGHELGWPPDSMHANVEQLPLAEVRDDPYESVFGESHVNRPEPKCSGLVIFHSDAVASVQRKEEIDFAF